MNIARDSRGRIRPVILSGGAGTRLWPLSRALYPKQLLPLASESTMLQDTAHRVADRTRFAAPLVVCNEEHRFLVAEQLRAVGLEAAAIVLEPEARNTAPAAAVAALLALEDAADSLLLVLPSDHTIADGAGFQAAVEAAAAAARAGALVTFGMAPSRPETGYGYIRRGPSLAGAPGCYRVERFVEKPDASAAQAMVESGDWLWNSGMFLFAAGRYLEELERHRAGVVAGCRAAIARGTRSRDFVSLERAAFAESPADSIDYAVMERTDSAAVVPASIGWSDVGSWSALWEIGKRDGRGNVLSGDVMVEGVANSYIRSEKQLVAAVGVEDMLVIATEDAVLVAPLDRTQEVKAVVERLKADGRAQHVAHLKVQRPWGSYQTIDAGDRFQVKQLTVKPGARLSLQMHRHRAEHWVVVQGTARVTRGEDVFDIGVNESTYIPPGGRHRLENPGTETLRVIEIQLGDYLGEDDIVRFEDAYGRAAK